MTILASVNNKTVMPGITPIADVPDAPTIGTATAVGLAASVTFTAATTGGTPTTYTATSNPGSLTGTASSSPVTVSGLTEGTSYTFTVTAGNSTGTSQSSSASNSITAVSPISGGYDALATVIVPSGGLSSVIFSGIPTGYKHLEVRLFAKYTGVGYGTLRVNNDSGSSYSNHGIHGDGVSSPVGYFSLANGTSYYYTNAGGTKDTTFNVSVISVLDYANTNKNKVFRALYGWDNNGTGYMEMNSGSWINTSAINRMELASSVGIFSQYSHIALYGVK